MKQERTISAYKNYFMDFISSLRKEEARKIYYILDMLKVQERVSSKFVKYLREELYEIRAEYGGNIFRKRLSKYIFYSSFSLLTFATKK